ncbi:MAG TPA: DUF1015 domain-containing protein [bacterium]|nr:DUF1015 domain-containing protein [bacterium]
MSIIIPFKGIRYDLRKGGELADLIAPPYDIINARKTKELRSRSPDNVVRLILPEEKAGDDARNNKYSRAAALWEQWRRDGTLALDPTPRLYRYMTSFSLKTTEGIVARDRPGFVALMQLHEYSEGKVLPHERTLAGPKQDRFQLMAHTRAHLSQVFMLYSDPAGAVDRALGLKPPAGTQSLSAEDDAGVTHLMWPVEDQEAIAEAARVISAGPVYIADGHHRYETALAYRRHVRQTSPLFAAGTDHVMAYFTPAEHPGLVIFPYHRLLHNLPKRRFSGLLKKLENYFQIDRALVSPLDPGAARREFIASLQERGRERTVFGMVDGINGHAYYLSVQPDARLARGANTPADSALASLDVVILEDLILIGMMDVKPKDLLNEKYVSYETDYDRTLDAVQKKENQMAFLMNPTPVGDVIKVADLAGIMPEKSTYFFPKLATGLVMNSMDP